METRNDSKPTISDSYPVESVRSHISRQGDDVRKYRRGIIDVLWSAKPLADGQSHALMFRVATMPDIAGLMFADGPRIAFKDGSSLAADSMSTTDLKMVKEGLSAHVKRLLKQKRAEKEQKAVLEKSPYSADPEFYRNIREKNGYVFPTAWAAVKATDTESLLAGKLRVVFFDSDESSIGLGAVPAEDPLLMEHPSGRLVCFLNSNEKDNEWIGRYRDRLDRMCFVRIDKDTLSMKQATLGEELAEAILMETRCADLLTGFFNRLSPDVRKKVYSEEEISVLGPFYRRHNEILLAAQRVVECKETQPRANRIVLEGLARELNGRLSPGAKIQLVELDVRPTFDRMYAIQESEPGDAERFRVPFHDQVVGDIPDFAEQMKVSGRYEGSITVKDGDATERIICEAASSGKGVIFTFCENAYADMIDGHSAQPFVIADGKAYDVDNKDIAEMAEGRTVELRCQETGEYVSFAYSIKDKKIVPSQSFEKSQKENLKRKEDAGFVERHERFRSEIHSKGLK